MKAPIEMMMDGVEWKPCEPPDDTSDGIPWATHTGVLNIGGCLLDVIVLNTGQRIITEESLNRFFGVDR